MLPYCTYSSCLLAENYFIHQLEEERDALLKRVSQLEADTGVAKTSLDGATQKLDEWNTQKEKVSSNKAEGMFSYQIIATDHVFYPHWMWWQILTKASNSRLSYPSPPTLCVCQELFKVVIN